VGFAPARTIGDCGRENAILQIGDQPKLTPLNTPRIIHAA
jgi:hypothetical protein